MATEYWVGLLSLVIIYFLWNKTKQQEKSIEKLEEEKTKLSEQRQISENYIADLLLELNVSKGDFNKIKRQLYEVGWKSNKGVEIRKKLETLGYGCYLEGASYRIVTGPVEETSISNSIQSLSQQTILIEEKQFKIEIRRVDPD